MTKTVFFKNSSSENVDAAQFISAQLPELRKILTKISQELSETGHISNERATKLPDGNWSMWLQSNKGEAIHFEMSRGAQEQSTTSKKRSVRKPKTVSRRFGVWTETVPGVSEKIEFIDAAEYIKKRFKVPQQAALLQALEQAQLGMGAADGSIEFTPKGVILRVPSGNKQNKAFTVEIEFVVDSNS